MKRFVLLGFFACLVAVSSLWGACGGNPSSEKQSEAKPPGDNDSGPGDARDRTDTGPTDKGTDTPADAGTEPAPDLVADNTPEQPAKEAKPEASPDTPAPPPPAKRIVYYTVTVRGKLKGTTEDAKKLHNQIIAGSAETVKKLGDMAHHVYLSMDKKEFLAIDVWRSLEGLNQFLQDPDAQKGFAQLFDGPPTITIWKHRAGWKQYWENDLTGNPQIRVMVQGKLKGTPEEGKTAHNAIISGSIDAARKLGDLSHHVFEDPKDASTFMAFDVWNDAKGLDSFFKDPNVQKSFATLFSAPPTITMWQKAEGWTPIDTTLYTVTVRGTLKGAVEDAKKVHNQIIAGASGIARSLGDLSHDAYLGVQDKKEFLGIDVWMDQKGLNQFLQDPNVQKSFGALFTGPPSITVSVERLGWKQYWENDLTGNPQIRVMVQGKLKGTPEEGKTAHNAIISGSIDAARKLGDLSHHVFEDPKEPNAFMAFDVWNDAKGLDSFFKDPNVQKSFATLFSAPPTISMWQKADGWDTY